MLTPVTWMMALNGSRPAEVITAPPNGIDPCFRIPGVDNHVNVLVEEITFDDLEVLSRITDMGGICLSDAHLIATLIVIVGEPPIASRLNIDLIHFPRDDVPRLFLDDDRHE